MSVTIDGTEGISKVQAASINQDDLADGVGGTGPAFSAYSTSNQSIPNGVETKVNLGVVQFDTDGCFSSSRFPPTTPGYYQITGRIGWVSGAFPPGQYCSIHKNGVGARRGQQHSSASVVDSSVVSGLVYLNGTTDYVELYALQGYTSAQAISGGGEAITFMNGFLARKA